MSPNEKNRLAGIFLMAHGGLLGFIYLAFFGLFFSLIFSDPQAPKAFLGVMFGFMAFFCSIFVVPQIIGGWKMYKQSPNSKVWGIIASVMACMNVPLGTAAGVFALIFLFSDEGNRFYQSLSETEGQRFLGGVNEVDEFRNRDFQNHEKPEMHGWR